MSKGNIQFKGTKEEMISSISGKIYQLSCESSKYREEKLNDLELLSITERNGETIIRVYSDVTPNYPDMKIIRAEADLKDAWQYYCKVGK